VPHGIEYVVPAKAGDDVPQAKRKSGSGRSRKGGRGSAKTAAFGRVAGSPAPTSHGRFCWYDLATPDVPAALRFYGELFGWTIQVKNMGPVIGGYHVASVGDGELGGIMPLPERRTPPCWLAYVGVPDIQAVCTAAMRADGAIHRPPTSIPGAGGFAVLSDPTGGVLAPIQLADPPTRDLTAPSVPGLVAWNELVTSDPERAGAFYARVFGWTVERIDLDRTPYWIFRRHGEDVAGMIEAPASPEPDAASWMLYFHVADADASAERVEGLGGAVLIPPFDVPTVGRCALIADPAGVVFRLYRPEED
jgi:predicted enzyme related to lactoylglutathione lyase